MNEVQSTHSAECYKWHHECAKAEVERLRAALAEPEHAPGCALLQIPSRDCDCESVHTDDASSERVKNPAKNEHMTREDIIRMARQAGFETLLPHEHIHGTGGVYVGDDDIAGMLERFAALVAAAEREECERIVQSYMDEAYIGDEGWDVARDVLNDIRARGQHE